jgi:hypothetical protein
MTTLTPAAETTNQNSELDEDIEFESDDDGFDDLDETIEIDFHSPEHVAAREAAMMASLGETDGDMGWELPCLPTKPASGR